jgi:hypothetical protein
VAALADEGHPGRGVRGAGLDAAAGAHPALAAALAAGQLSVSWARTLCGWTDQLPGHARPGADQILLDAALAGAELADLARLAEEIRARTAAPDTDGRDDGFADRRVQLDLTYQGAGRLTGDLTPGCAAALSAVLAALGNRAGPEDLRTTWQRDHDALEEACRRLIASAGLPDRAGQATQIQLHMTLDQLRGLPGAAGAEAAWSRGWWPAAGPGTDCDASIVPVVTGHPDPAVLDQLAAVLLRPSHVRADPPAPPGCGPADPAATRAERAGQAIQRLLLGHAARILSGPGGLAAWLRTGLLAGPAASVSLPLDVGAATDTIPAHLRRAVTARDRHCRFPGCAQPPSACQVHHLIPRSEGGPTTLANMTLACTFHHLIAIHRWGWSLVLHADGTTATSPGGDRTLHSHSPPAAVA